MKLLFVFLIVTTLQSQALATPVAEMTQYFSNSIRSTDHAVNECSMSTRPDPSAEIWYFRRFWLRVRPKVAFSVPLFARLEIAPELEMLWQR